MMFVGHADIPLTAVSAAAVAPTGAALHCSVAVVAATQHAQHPPAAAAASSSAGFQVLVSSGKGDLVLVSSTPGQPGETRLGQKGGS
jgi:hypothetical protein